MTSKTAFDTDDSSLGRIDTLSIAPPQTLASLRSQVMKAEGLVNQNIQLFEDMDGEVPMNDNDTHISFQTYVYPGHDEDHPITVVCSQQSRGEVKSFSKQIIGLRGSYSNKSYISVTCYMVLKFLLDPNKEHQADWLPYKLNEIMYTDGVKTIGYISTSNILFYHCTRITPICSS